MQIRSCKLFTTIGKGTVLAFGLACLILGKTVFAQEMPQGVREHIRKATGQILMGSKTPGEDKIDGIAWGSGWFINSTGLMVTNDHVVNWAHCSPDPFEAFQKARSVGIYKYRITLNGGTDEEKFYYANRMYQSESADLALLQVLDEDDAPLQTPHYLELIPSEEIKEGMRVYTVGYPHGDRMAKSKDKQAEVSVSAGNITEVVYAPSGRIKKFRSDAEIAGGNSGGPMVDLHGRCVGVNVEGGVDPGEDTGVSCGQIPADVVIDVLRAALGLNKIDTDLAPFLHLLLDKNLMVFVPGKERKKDKDVVEFKDGERTSGQITDQELEWKTPLGSIKLPIKAAGFVINDSGTARLLLDGGERFSADASDVVLNFTSSRGQESKLNMSNLRSVLFKKPTQIVELPDIDTIALVGDGCKMYLANVQGDIKFADDNQGKISLALDEIRKIDTRYYKQEIHKTDGSLLTGKFEPHTIKATLAVSNTPFSFSLFKAKQANLKNSNPRLLTEKRVKLSKRLGINEDHDYLTEIAELLEDGNWKKAGALLGELMDPGFLKEKEKPTRQQIEVLQADFLLRKGNYKEAFKGFKGLRRAKIEGVAWYASGRYHVLKLHPEGDYQGQQLSDPKVFDRAAQNIADQIIASACEIMDAHGKTKIAKFSDWSSLESKASRMEKDLQIATSLILWPGEKTKFQMWRFRQKRNWDGLKMLFDTFNELVTELETRRANNRPTASIVRKINRIRKQIDTILIKYRALRQMMNPLGDGPGYRLDDPDAEDFMD